MIVRDCEICETVAVRGAQKGCVVNRRIGREERDDGSGRVLAAAKVT